MGNESQTADLLTPEVTRLRTALQSVQFQAVTLLGGAGSAKRDLDSGSEPHASEWPGRTPGDPDLVKPGDVLTLMGEDAWRKREIGWPRTLDKMTKDLTEFWAAWDESQAALDSLPKEATCCLDAASKENWVARVRKTLEAIGEWHYWSRPKQVDGNSFPVNLLAFLQVLRKQELPDWSDLYQTLSTFDADLRILQSAAVQGREGDAK